MQVASEKRLISILLAFFLGGFGIHKFYLGRTRAGIIQLLLTFCFGIGHAIGVIEAILYALKSDSQFYSEYITGSREWF